MTVPADPPAHRRLTFSGIFGPVAFPWERWSFRLNMFVGAGDVTDPTALLAAAVAAYERTMVPLVKGMVVLTEVKHALIGADGLYNGGPQVVPTNIGGGVAGGPTPLQIALVASLRTGLRGANNRGRLYIPGPGFVLGADGLISPADAQAAANGVSGLLTDINAVPGNSNVAIASSKGTVNVVSAVRVGRVLDTIRSRRRSQQESYGADIAVGI